MTWLLFVEIAIWANFSPKGHEGLSQYNSFSFFLSVGVLLDESIKSRSTFFNRAAAYSCRVSIDIVVVLFGWGKISNKKRHYQIRIYVPKGHSILLFVSKKYYNQIPAESRQINVKFLYIPLSPIFLWCNPPLHLLSVITPTIPNQSNNSRQNGLAEANTKLGEVNKIGYISHTYIYILYSVASGLFVIIVVVATNGRTRLGCDENNTSNVAWSNYT